MIDKKNLARFVSCTQEEYNSLYPNNDNLYPKEDTGYLLEEISDKNKKAKNNKEGE